jgi:cellulose synthase/poly-beta-1,6-N-acetylglucosamine synthase-like glycosyltransferase
MKFVFWSLCALILWSFIVYPLVIELIALVAGRRYLRDDALVLPVSILIPAYNEERIIAAKIENALALDYPADKMEIIVASESSDATDDIVRGFVATHGARVKLLTSPIRRGKVANLHRAVPSSTGELLVFTDANAMFKRDALRLLVRNFADPRVGAVSGRLVLKVPGRSPSGTAEQAYWGLEMMIKRASGALGSLPGANGSMFALRRGVYRPISEHRGDDFELPIRAIIDGHASILELEAISEEETSQKYRQEYRRKVRIINWMIVSALILFKEAVMSGRWLLAFQLLSHKLNRWATAIWLLALLPVSLLLAQRGRIYLLAVALQVVIYALALVGLALRSAGLRVPKLFGHPLYFVVINSASLMGILTCITGRQVTWHKRSDGVP